MAGIFDAFKTAFREYVVDGVPSSGKQKPRKQDIQPIGQLIDTQIDEVRTIALAGARSPVTVRVIATANVALANGLENGDTVDGVVLATGDVVVLAGQTDPIQNGAYVVVASGAASRHPDYNDGTELVGAQFAVLAGTRAGQVWAVRGQPVIGTDPISITYAFPTSVTADGSVSNPKLANVPTATIKGRATAGTGTPEDLTPTQAKTILALNNVDNTSDVNKPVSGPQSAMQIASPEFLQSFDPAGSPANGALYIADGNGRNVGLSIPAASSGAGAYLTAFVALDGVQAPLAADLVGKTIRLVAEFDISAGFMADKNLFTSQPAQVRRGGSAAGITVGTLVRSELIGTTRLIREVDYVVTANDTAIGPLVRIPNSAVANADHSIKYMSVRWFVSQEPVARAKRPANFALDSNLAAQKSDLQTELGITSGDVFAARVEYDGASGALNGATLLSTGGKAAGLSIPAAATGASSYITAMIPFTGSQVASLAGRTLRWTAVYTISTNFMTEKNLRSNVARALRAGSIVNVGTLVSQTVTGNVLTRVFDYTVDAADTAIGPMAWLPNSAVANADHVITLVSMKWAISGPNANDLLLAARLAALQFTGGNPETPIVEEVQAVGALVVSQPVGAITLPEVSVVRPSGNLTVAAGSVTIVAPASTAVVDEVATLTYSSDGGGLDGVALAYQYPRSVTVKRSSDGASLSASTDYRISASGRLSGRQNVAGYAVKVSYTGYTHRYDLIYADATTGALGVAKGTDRVIDPEEYRPALPAGKIALFGAYVTIDGVELIPVHKWRNGLPLLQRAAVSQWLTDCELALSRTLGRLRRGDPVRVIGYGDSITAIEGSGTQDQLIAGGNKDRSAYLARIPTDTRALYPVFDGTDPDFAGSTYSDHRKIGWNWYLVDHLRTAYGAPIAYRNWGVGGTRSGNEINSGNGRMGGLYPDRLNAMLADNGHLMVLAFGMNELGSTATYGNVRAIIEAFQATGGEVIVMTTPQISAYRGVQSSWLFTHDELIRAALDTGSAYVSAQMLFGAGNEGACGLSRFSASDTNLYNHPGPVEFALYGRALTWLFR